MKTNLKEKESEKQLPLRLPPWIRVVVPDAQFFWQYERTEVAIKKHKLTTVCTEARCPNRTECWSSASMTFMILGSVCTRGCLFCAVNHAKSGESVDTQEPKHLVAAIQELKLKYVVLTSVDRDDLPDKGAGHFALCCNMIRQKCPTVGIELLIPDYTGQDLLEVLETKPTVLAHNIETIARLQHIRDSKASYTGSLQTLSEASRWSKKHSNNIMIKTSILLGIGETKAELIKTLSELRAVGCQSLVLGQYLRPSLAQMPVREYISPEKFIEYGKIATSMGFARVVSTPMARTSYHANLSAKEM